MHQSSRPSSTPSLPGHLSGGDARSLLRWASANGRGFPWRDTRDPYVTAVTELMLVRTRAEQVRSVWGPFFHKYPTLDSLAAADDAEIASILRPLGLEWRGRRVLEFARAAAATSRWPERIRSLPGGGPYVAAATELAAVGRGSIPVDVTIARVVARYWGLPTRGEARRDPAVLGAVQRMGRRSRRFFYAWLDLAAKNCTPAVPNCHSCPIRGGCAHGRSRIDPERPDAT